MKEKKWKEKSVKISLRKIKNSARYFYSIRCSTQTTFEEKIFLLFWWWSFAEQDTLLPSKEEKTLNFSLWLSHKFFFSFLPKISHRKFILFLFPNANEVVFIIFFCWEKWILLMITCIHIFMWRPLNREKNERRLSAFSLMNLKIYSLTLLYEHENWKRRKNDSVIVEAGLLRSLSWLEQSSTLKLSCDMNIFHEMRKEGSRLF